jgi:hypothetical protein
MLLTKTRKRSPFISCTRIAMAALILSCASREAAPSSNTIESSHPPWFARVDGGNLISITLPPRELNLDMNAANSVKSETGDFKPARYSFPGATVPRSTLAHLAGIYRYDRRRDVPIVSSGGDWIIAEYFKARSHVPTSRFRLLGDKVQRQEQLDVKGRVTKVILVGWAQPHSAEDLEPPPDIAVLGEHPAWIRVFRVAPDGKPTLVALAWRTRSSTGPAQTLQEPDERDLAFGLPDGTIRWHSLAAFAKAQGLDLHASSLSGTSRRS